MDSPLFLKDFKNQKVVWEYRGFAGDYALAKSQGGWFDLSNWSTVKITGPDAADYLHRMSTVNFKKPQVGQVSPGAFLTGKAVPILWGYFVTVSATEFLYLVPPGQGEFAAEHLEQFHFQENLQVALAPEWKAMGLWDFLLSELHLAEPMMPGFAVPDPATGAWIWKDPFRSQLSWVLIPQKEMPMLQNILEVLAIPQLGYRLFEFFRLDAGLISVREETTDKTLALEAGLEHSISPQKGCYPGQEVVERILSYGRVNRKLARVELESWDPDTALPAEVVSEAGAVVGSLVAAEVLPDNPQKAYGIAYIHRTFLDKPEELQLKSESAAASIKLRLRS